MLNVSKPPMPSFWFTIFTRPLFHLFILFLIGLQAFFANIQGSLFGEMEGLYANVTHHMMAGGDFFKIRMPDGPYHNKPPLFFWVQAGLIEGFGWSEAVLRLPSALASLGTMIVTYFFGRLLFSDTAGFWAALVVATCYAGLWFGPLGIIDPIMTFFMTCGLYVWARGYFESSSSWWYAVGFLALACGTMVKTLHGLALPALMFGIFLYVRRDPKPFKNSWFWVGGVACGLILIGYYFLLGQDFREHFFFKENIQRLITQRGDVERSALDAYWGKRPIHWYAYTIWFDLFPWSVLIPFGLLLLWQRRSSWKRSPEALWVWVWVIVYFLAFSLVPEKHERYLLPLLPAAGLVVGYIYHRVLTEHTLEFRGKLLRILIGITGAAFVVLPFLGPHLLHKKWYVGLDIFPLLVQIALSLLGLLIIFLAGRAQLRVALCGMGVLGLALLMMVTEYIIPGILAQGSPRIVLHESQRALKNPSDPIFGFQWWNWRGDEDVFYLDSFHGNSRVVGKDLDIARAKAELYQEVRKYGELSILMTEDQFQQNLATDPTVNGTVIFSFYRSKKRIVLVSVSERSKKS